MVSLLLTKLDTDTSAFIASLINKGEYKSTLVLVSLANALSDGLKLPTEPIDDIGIEFAMTYKTCILNKLIAINELITIDIDATLELVKNFYACRYVAYKGMEVVPFINKDTAVEDFFGISKYIGKDIIAVIKEHGCTITDYINKFKRVLEKLEMGA